MSFGSLVETGALLQTEGDYEGALKAYEAALMLIPDHPQVLVSSAIVLFRLGQFPEALRRTELSLEKDPSRPDVWFNLAYFYRSQGRKVEAAAALRQTLAIEEGDRQALGTLAALEIELDHPEEAVALARRALEIDPTYTDGWYHLALAARAMGDARGAVTAARRALELADGESRLYGFLADVELSAGEPQNALETANRGLTFFPSDPVLQLLAARILDVLRRPDEALARYRAAHRLAPEDGTVLSELVYLAMQTCTWEGIGILEKELVAGAAAGRSGITPFSLLCVSPDRALQRKCAATWASQFVRAIPARRPILQHRPLRLGYLSSDFHQHATSILAVGLFENHNRTRFEVFGYSTGIKDSSPMRARVEKSFDHFLDAHGWQEARLADRIREDEIDILIDLKGYTDSAPSQVGALRPAPIQVQYLGFPGTMAAPWIDYLIADSIVIPSEHAADYSEAIVRLPHSYQVNDGRRALAVGGSRAAVGLPEDVLVLCCFNNTSKINRAVFEAWMEILRGLPEAVLWLLIKPHQAETGMRLRNQAARAGIEPKRLIFSATRPHDDYLALFSHADLFLDTWPYNAHTTASDALWGGCPVLTILGESFAGRVASSLVTAVGLPELSVGSVEEYVASAIRIGKDAKERDRLHAHLRDGVRTSPLFDTLNTTQAIESAYEKMVENYARGVVKPIDLKVA